MMIGYYADRVMTQHKPEGIGSLSMWKRPEASNFRVALESIIIHFVYIFL